MSNVAFDYSRVSADRSHIERRARMAAMAVPDDGILTDHEQRALQRAKCEAEDAAKRKEIEADKERQLLEAIARCKLDEERIVASFRYYHPTLAVEARRCGLSVKLIQVATADYYKMSVGDLLAPRRFAHLIRKRQVAIYLAKTLKPRSLPEVARRFSKDHTTILWAVRKIGALRLTDPALNETITQIEASIAAAMAAAAPAAACAPVAMCGE
jgi:chromosomal replication initiation ATPase DnaA